MHILGAKKHLQIQKEKREPESVKELRNALRDANQTMNATRDRVKTSFGSIEIY